MLSPFQLRRWGDVKFTEGRNHAAHHIHALCWGLNLFEVGHVTKEMRILQMDYLLQPGRKPRMQNKNKQFNQLIYLVNDDGKELGRPEIGGCSTVKHF